jgi:O-antigen/teichoic acid export membrane protein
MVKQFSTWVVRDSVSSGIAYLSVGSAINAVANIALVGVVARNFDEIDSALFLTWWATVTSAAIGLGLIEVTIARKLVHGSGSNKQKLQAKFLGEGISVTMVFSLILVTTSLGVFTKYPAATLPYFLSLLIFPFLTLIQVLQRGEALSRQKFPDSANQLVVDGISRLAISFLLVQFTSLEIQALILCCSLTPLVSILFMRYRLNLTFTIPRNIREFTISSELLRLSTSTLGVIFVSYLISPWFSSQIDSAQLVMIFIASLTLSRIPMQFMGSVFSPIMVHISILYERGERDKAKNLEVNILKRTSIVVLIFIPTYVCFAPALLSIYLGTYQHLSLWIMFGHALVSGLLLLASVFQAILLARNSWATISKAWSPAIVLMAILFVVPGDTLWIAVLGPLVASLYALLRLSYPFWKNRNVEVV